MLGFDLDPVDGVFQPSENEPQGVYAIVKSGPVWIHLQIRSTEIPKPERHSIERDIYVYVNDVSAVFADLKSRGAEIASPIRETFYGIDEFDVVDLNGYRLTFGQVV